MARVKVTSFVDDLDGKPLGVDDARSVMWSWAGVVYRLDTSKVNLAKIEDGRVPLAKLLAVSTRVGGRRHPTATRIDPPTRRQSTTPDPAQVREWATANGYSVSARGRLPRNVVDAYDAAH
ncbi:Lsr2 family protein [Gordonia sp. VNQ95]|uniref:histone-like nucleoid-structuring protein Lsr2 n=1 Tax=Gordonia TaxID=2053 RepID=UPI0032B5940A